MTKPQKLHVYPETRTCTPPLEMESAHTHPLDSITAVPPAASHTWPNDLPRELEKDGEHEELQKNKMLLQTTAATFDPTAPHMSSNPYDNTAAYLDLNTSGMESQEMERKDESKEMGKNDEDGECVERWHSEEKNEAKIF